MADNLTPDKMKKVLEWATETMIEFPEKTRIDIFHEAEIRFDLSPRECEFLNANFARDCDKQF